MCRAIMLLVMKRPEMSWSHVRGIHVVTSETFTFPRQRHPRSYIGDVYPPKSERSTLWRQRRLLSHVRRVGGFTSETPVLRQRRHRFHVRDHGFTSEASAVSRQMCQTLPREGLYICSLVLECFCFDDNVNL